MIKFSAAVLAALILAFMAHTALAQDHTRNWDNGHVVAVTEVHVKDGMFNAYINDLNNVWRKFLETEKKDGSVISYGIYVNATPRHEEPDLYLTVTYANWAAFDRGEEYWNNIREQVIGSEENMRQANSDRGELRTIGSRYKLQEIKFRD